MTTLNFIGSWGERLETERESARRMQRSWQLAPRKPEIYTPWSLQLYPAGELQLQPVAEDDLDAIVAAARFVTERVDQGPRTAPGCYLDFVRERLDEPVAAGGPLFAYDVRCGFAGPRAPRNHLYREFDPAVGNTTDQPKLLCDELTSLVLAWEPEFISVCTYAFDKAQRHRTPQVRIGWLTYIRDDVPLDEGAVPARVRIEAGDGGRYLTLSGTPWEPDLDEALAIRGALGYG